MHKITQITSGPGFFTAEAMSIAFVKMLNTPSRKLFPSVFEHDRDRARYGSIGNRYQVTLTITPIDENGNVIDE